MKPRKATQSPPYRAAPLEGLDYTTTIHVAWVPPYDNGVPIDVFQLYADGVLQKNVTASSPQFILSDLTPATTHTFSVRAANARGVHARIVPALVALLVCKHAP